MFLKIYISYLDSFLSQMYMQVTYFEYIRTSEILLRDDTPRLKIWDDYMIQEFLALDGNSGDGRAFGLLEVIIQLLFSLYISSFTCHI